MKGYGKLSSTNTLPNLNVCKVMAGKGLQAVSYSQNSAVSAVFQILPVVDFPIYVSQILREYQNMKIVT